MSLRKKGLAITLSLALVASSLAFQPAQAAKKLKLSKKKVTITVGSKKKITVKNATKKTKVTWKSSKKSVAKITKKKAKGKKAYATIKGIKKGTAKITATYKQGKKKKKLTCKVTVAPKNTETGNQTPTPTPPTNQGSNTPTPPASQGPGSSDQPTTTPEPTATPTPTPTHDISLDLSNENSYLIDGEGTTATYNNTTNMLDLNVNNFEGIIFANPAKNVDEYKSVTITYIMTDKEINTYIFDGEMDNDGVGQEPGGQEQQDSFSASDQEVTVTYKASQAMYGFKMARIDWDNGEDVDISIKSIVFS